MTTIGVRAIANDTGLAACLQSLFAAGNVLTWELLRQAFDLFKIVIVAGRGNFDLRHHGAFWIIKFGRGMIDIQISAVLGVVGQITLQSEMRDDEPGQVCWKVIVSHWEVQ